MIPTKADDETLERYVQAAVSTYLSSTEDQKVRARLWYPQARELALMIGDGDVRLGAGLLAALSVNKAWSQNKRLAFDAASGNVHGNVGHALRRAQMILEGQDPLEVLPADSKTWNFYRCITDPYDPDPVCVDRHVHDALIGESYGNRDRGLQNKTRYATLALAVRLAARRLGVIPSYLQALLWLVQVDSKYSKGQYGHEA